MNLDLIIVSALMAILGAALGIVLGRYVFPVIPAGTREELASASQDKLDLERRHADLQRDRDRADHEAATKGNEVATLTERSARQQEKIDDVAKSLNAITISRDQIKDQNSELLKEVALLKQREADLTAKLSSQEARLIELQKQLTTEFENIAERVLKARSQELQQHSQAELGTILGPLKESLATFQTKIDTTYGEERRDILSLKGEIEQIIKTSVNVGNQADSLARALRGDSQAMGRWGELALERILETAGLVEGREYKTQGRGLALRNEEGELQKPDVLVLLPEQRVMVVDSKTPLASYDRFISSSDEDERQLNAKQLVRDMKVHIDSLGKKRYQDHEQLVAHDCVLMFVPIEGALAVALAKDPELFTYAWKQNVVLVGPPTLLMTLRTVASIWRYQLQSENAQEIARIAGMLCDKIGHSLTDFSIVADRLRSTADAHQAAVKRLAGGKSGALRLGERIQELGVKTKKPMPSMLIDGAPIVDMEIDEDGDAPLAQSATEGAVL